jgi:hypothetical protein
MENSTRHGIHLKIEKHVPDSTPTALAFLPAVGFIHDSVKT